MAHNYSTDSDERRYMPFFIAAAAIAASFATFSILNQYHIVLPWWLSPPIDTMAFYGAFYGVFDRIIWKWSWVHRLRITKIPNLSGTWRGHVDPARGTNSFQYLGTKTEITLVIKQTWSTLLVVGQTHLSHSHSLSGTFITSHECTLSYEYFNEPLAHAVGTMHTHRGFARLTVDGAYRKFEGEYYSGRDRQSFGTIRLTRIA